MENKGKYRNKILFFIKTPPPVTGATLMNQRVHNSKLLRNTFDIHSIQISYQDSLSEMGKFSAEKIIKVLNVLKQLWLSLIKFCPDVVYFQISPHGLAFIRDFGYVVIMKMFRVPIIFHMRGKGIRNKTNFVKKMFKVVFKNEYAICLSKLLAYDISDVHLGPIYYVSNGIEDYYDNNFYKPSMDNQSCSILFLSNLCKSKGIIDFLNLLDRLREDNISFTANIIGAENRFTKAELLELVQKFKLQSQVRYLGALYGEQKHKVIKESDILIYPSHEDCFPNVIIESMMHGVPVVANNEGAIPDMIDDGVTGYVVPKTDIEQLFNRTKELILDDSLRKKMGLAARHRFINNFTLNHFDKNMKNTFFEILDEIKNK